MQNETVVLFPLASMGHLTPMVELAKLLLQHGLSVSIPISQSPFFDNAPADAYISRVSAAHPSISFHRLPPLAPLPSPSPPKTPNFFFDHLRHAVSLLRDYLRSLPSVEALVLDFFLDDAVNVAAELNLRHYFLLPVSASTVAAFLYLPILHNVSNASFKDLGDTPVHFPGLPFPIPASDMPDRIADRSSETYKALLLKFERIPRSDGILVNTFSKLEPESLRALADGLCTPGRALPPVYCVGPITNKGNSALQHESLSWLDGQPKGSVVFLCFGSAGVFSEAQIMEIATGLERSGQKFLWVVKKPPGQGREVMDAAATMMEPDLEELLPQGFLDRTADRGKVVKSWAPQVEVLEHVAVGGFVTHCGWNSVLESIVAGVAMIAWPLYAEQKMNKEFLVKAAGLAVEMRGYKDEVVVAAEVEEKVRWLMESEGGKELRKEHWLLERVRGRRCKSGIRLKDLWWS
ncbi:hypothetical protein HPP92_027005 [Vanilla planifolia]|uniref:Uncharacterized protein n=1 Tax=Vanilla planifolia TaxID=51239 RepID=A0A835U8G2_VANPL|nr:hypothetical protein HPP92_027005 [Vanilla planifolia]